MKEKPEKGCCAQKHFDAKNFLVLETTKLESTIKELSATAEFISHENATNGSRSYTFEPSHSS